LELAAGARIGILNVLESQMTHVDVGTLRFDSFTHVYTVDWDLPGFMNRTIETGLKSRGGYTLVPLALIAPADRRQSTANAILSAVNDWMPGDLKAFLQQSAEENRLDAIITVSSYDSGMWPDNACFTMYKDAVDTKGYGLFTWTRALSGLSGLLPVGQNQANAYANILVAVFQTRPVSLAAYAAAPCDKPALRDFPWDSDLQVLSPAVIKQVRPEVERLGAEAVQKGLGNAGLAP
jgi:hypothetical protein